MTDTDVYIPALKNGSTGENGAHEQAPIKWEEEMSLEEVNGTIKSSSGIEESIENFKDRIQLNGNVLGQEADITMLSEASKVENAAHLLLVMLFTLILYLTCPCNFTNRNPKWKI